MSVNACFRTLIGILQLIRVDSIKKFIEDAEKEAKH